MALLKYIHFNPVRAKIVEKAPDYQWSSEPAYRKRSNEEGLVDTETVFRMFSENRSRARLKYVEFMDDGVTVKKQEVYATIDQRLLGDDQFVDRIAEEHGRPIKKEWRKREYTLAQIAGAAAQVGENRVDDLRSSSRLREIVQGRVAFTVIAKEYGYRGIEVAEFLRKDPTAITLYGRKREEAKQLIKQMEGVLRSLDK